VAKITLAKYREKILEGIERIPAIEVLVADAAGSILAEDLIAEGPIPASSIATCDGYAVVASDIAGAKEDSPVSLPVSHDVAWGARGPGRHVPKAAARIVSGAPIPTGADAIVPIGATDGGIAKVSIAAAVKAGANIRARGTDAEVGQVLIPAGTRLGARQLGLAAGQGRRRVSVHPTPRVVILSVGNELSDPGSKLRDAGVPESNSHTLAVMVGEAGARAFRVGAVQDDRPLVKTTIEDQLVRADLILTTGGLSGASGDTLPEVLADLGSFEDVQVAMMPGRRHGYGLIESGGSGPAIPVIALPGHPAAAIVAFELYVRPVLRTMSAYPETDRHRFRAKATRGWESPPGVLQAVPVQVTRPRMRDATATAVGNPWQPSLVDIVRANGLAIVPEDTTKVGAGDDVLYLLWDD
jgi:molybdopterin molybdotransferase